MLITGIKGVEFFVQEDYQSDGLADIRHILTLNEAGRDLLYRHPEITKSNLTKILIDTRDRDGKLTSL